MKMTVKEVIYASFYPSGSKTKVKRIDYAYTKSDY